jgi:hypothetical protein
LEAPPVPVVEVPVVVEADTEVVGTLTVTDVEEGDVEASTGPTLVAFGEVETVPLVDSAPVTVLVVPLTVFVTLPTVPVAPLVVSLTVPVTPPTADPTEVPTDGTEEVLAVTDDVVALTAVVAVLAALATVPVPDDAADVAVVGADPAADVAAVVAEVTVPVTDSTDSDAPAPTAPEISHPAVTARRAVARDQIRLFMLASLEHPST